jgi:fluoride exporter
MNPALAATLWVGLGSAIGGIARYWTGVAAARMAGESFPWGTLLINIIGSFVIGYFGTLSLPDGPRPVSAGIRLFVLVGFCGGFTTFSSFSLQTVELIRDGEIGRAAAYIASSVVLCLLGTIIGIYAGQAGSLVPAGGGP